MAACVRSHGCELGAEVQITKRVTGLVLSLFCNGMFWKQITVEFQQAFSAVYNNEQ
jgi:hypothetical protein